MSEDAYAHCTFYTPDVDLPCYRIHRNDMYFDTEIRRTLVECCVSRSRDDPAK